jgi:lipopolysaccharide assembly protein A
MSTSHNTPNEPTEAIAAVESRPEPISSPKAEPRMMTPPGRVPRTRTSATWIGICAAAIAVVALIIFMMQNTANVEVTFLWMHGTLPLALALLIAGVGVTMLAMIVGTLRITQLRRLFARRSGESHRPDVSRPTS